jgi:hypothetical protein
VCLVIFLQIPGQHNSNMGRRYDIISVFCVPDIRLPPQVRERHRRTSCDHPLDFIAAIGLDYDVGGGGERTMFLRTRGERGDDMETDMKREANHREGNLTDRSQGLTPATYSIAFQSPVTISTALPPCDTGSQCLSLRRPLRRNIHSHQSS